MALKSLLCNSNINNYYLNSLVHIRSIDGDSVVIAAFKYDVYSASSGKMKNF